MTNQIIVINDDGESVDCSFVVDYSMLEQMSACALSVKEMAALLGVTDEVFRLRRKVDEKFNRTLIAGKAKVTFNSAKIVVNTINGPPANAGPNTPPMPTATQVEAAILYLKTHAGWQPRKE